MNRIAAALALGLAAITSGCATYSGEPVASAAIEQRDPVTILIAIDGFHPSYLDRGLTPTLPVWRRMASLRRCDRPFPARHFPTTGRW